MRKVTCACCPRADPNGSFHRLGFAAAHRRDIVKKLLLILLIVGIAVVVAKQAGLIKVETAA